ncbi:MAG TPA: PQQ-binding-like beta-propeller repeat protein [Bryobacteraceae bacterium]|nr:PQQ-binding-like beta-propeller repeat protein [Bryobacteraceae bacterium]
MRYVCLLALITPALYAQDGAALYKERCASCHDAPAARVPALSTIKAMSGEAIYVALTSGVMKTEAQGLSTVQLFALIGYIGPTGGARTESNSSFAPTCKGDNVFRADAKSPQWNGWSASPTNSRFEEAGSARLSASDIPKLKLKWAFNLGDVTAVRSQATVAGGRVFITTERGAVYALDAQTGCTWWGFQAGPGTRSGITLGDANGTPAAFVSDSGGTMYALNAGSGELIWKNKESEHFATMATATPRFYKGVVYQPFSSFEETLGADPKYGCCTFRGSVVAVDAATGKKRWETFTVAEMPKPTRKTTAGTQLVGPSGAGIWSSPTIDEQLGVLYVATGDNYSDPPTNTSDAILAMDLKTGELSWSRQLTENDAFNTACSIPGGTNCPEAKGPDYDFGQPPILVNLGGGKRALVIGQKSGKVYAIDPDQKGKVLWQTQAGAGSALGGSQWGSAADGQNIYVAISDPGIGGVADPKSPLGFRLTLDPKKGGGLHAIDLKTGKIVWDAKPILCAAERTDCSPAQSAAVTAIPGVVFSGAVDGHLRAYSAKNGDVLWDTDTEREFQTVNGKPAHGGSMDAAGPAVVNGTVFVNSGYAQWGGMQGNVFLAFSVDGK